MAAEALNETGKTADAISLINEVRKRAGVAELETSLSNYAALYSPNNKMAAHTFIPDDDNVGKVRRALYWERGFELCYESVRKYDLIRWGILGKVLKSIPKATNYIANEKFVEGKHELFPIPQHEIEANKELNGKNNPGY